MWPRTPPTSDMTTPLSAALARRAPQGPLWLAYSGGLDSTVLLHCLVEAGLGPRLAVVHVDHGLHRDSAAWAAHCRREVAALGLDCRVETVSVDGGDGLEANARRARYDALCRHAAGGTLITAHHRDDQAETLLLRLLRGAGPAGLAGIPEHGHWRGTRLWRPLLAVPRSALRERAGQGGWSWLDDPSNADTELDRNYLRARILPDLQARWPGASATLARAAEHQAQAAELLAERARQDMAALGAGERNMPLVGIMALSAARVGNLLRVWLADAGAPPPSSAILAQVRTLLVATSDRSGRVEWGGWQLRRFRGHLHLLESDRLQPLAGGRDWASGDGELDLGAWRLVAGEGVPALWLAADAGPLRLVAARGGERLLRNGCHQRVGELWRAAGVPPWWRGQWPLVYENGELVSVPGVGVSDDWKDRPLAVWHLQRR